MHVQAHWFYITNGGGLTGCTFETKWDRKCFPYRRKLKLAKRQDNDYNWMIFFSKRRRKCKSYSLLLLISALKTSTWEQFRSLTVSVFFPPCCPSVYLFVCQFAQKLWFPAVVESSFLCQNKRIWHIEFCNWKRGISLVHLITIISRL